MSASSLRRFYAIPPALLLAVPVLSVVIVLAFARRSSRQPTARHFSQAFLPVFSLSLVSLLIGGFGVAGIHDSDMASAANVLATILRLELAICCLVLIVTLNSSEVVPKRQLWAYSIVLSLLLLCATLFSLISTFLPARMPSLLPPFLYLLFTTLTLPLIVYLLLAPDPQASPSRNDYPCPISALPATSDSENDTPPPSPSSTKHSFALHHLDTLQSNFPRPSNRVLPIHVPIRFHQSRGNQTRNALYRDRGCILGILLLAQSAVLFSSAFAICVTALVPNVYDNTMDRMKGELQLGVWKVSVTLQCIENIFLLISSGCMVTVCQYRFFYESEATRGSWLPPLTPHRLRHRRQVSTTSSFCSPGFRSKSLTPVLPHLARPTTPTTPTPAQKSHPSVIFSENEPTHPPAARVRYQFPCLNPTLPLRPRVQPPDSPPLDAFNMNDPFAPPSPGAVPRYSVRESTAGTTRLSAWGTLTLPVPRNSPPRLNRGESTGRQRIAEEARLAEKLLERLDHESER